jgi:ABC-type glycerol-3-phosphate transport system substrate-binding protein
MAGQTRKVNWFAIWVSVGVVVALVVVAGLVIFLNNQEKGGGGTGETPTASNIDSSTGAIIVGAGEQTMDTYVDFMCPICNQFEQAYGPAIQGLVDDGTITLGIHPIAILDGPWVTPAQKQAATKLVTFLRSPPVQTTALRFGFRPALTSVPIKSGDANNPFTKMQQYGLAVELPDAAQPVDGAVVRNLLMMWSRVVKK